MDEFKNLKIAVAGTGYVGLSIATLLSQHHKVTAVDIIPEKVELINQRKSPIQDEYIEKYLTEKRLALTATLDAEKAYTDADFVVIAAPTNYDPKKNFFDTSAVEAVIKLVIQYNPDAIMVIKSIKKVKPDIVFTYTIKPNVYGGMSCARLGVPYVANVTGLGTAIANGGFLQKISLILYKVGLRKAQKVFFQNTENQDFMLKHRIISTPYDMLPGSGVNLKQYQVQDYPNGENTDFVFAARVMKEKGIDQYLDAAKYIHKKYPNTRFHICGFCEQDYEEQLEKLREQDVIIYHGLVSDMTKIYKMCSCTVHPTYYPEGMSNVLLESAASARPIITTNRSGCREIVDDGVNGYVVREKDSKDLIEKIEKFLDLSVDERRQMGLAGRRKVEKEFDRQIVVEKYMAEIDKAR